ncbi:YqjF family protein [Leptospira stimsonii]|uniref:DUF2071 domain-containing protein n=1 Tax=Leptospira stimsonii TaxID=2202203 RepID=A0ABY2MXE5_9LEPT|nr:DUF2071 domain-containing protein [Leptospira stimsonii]TGM10695.1 DUF2071 domain-containing protein [Leptospira stimsonii]
MVQYWEELAFLHWEIPKEFLDEVLPKDLEADLFDGKAYIGLVPFRMRGVRPIYLPPLPWLSYFPELNVRTYVKNGDKPGVFFFSLDAGNRLVVEIARKFFYLPYLNAKISIRREDNQKEFFSMRKDHRAATAEFHAEYKPISEVYRSKPGTLENWLTERYCLYSQDSKGRIYRGEVHHVPWPLQKGKCIIRKNALLQSHGIRIREDTFLVHYSESIQVLLYPLEQIS